MADPAPDDLPPDAMGTRRQRHASMARTAVLAVGGGAALFVLGSIFIDTGLIGHRDETPAEAVIQPAAFVPPDVSSIPDGPEGDDFVLIRLVPRRIELMSFADRIHPEPYGLKEAVLERRDDGWARV